MNHFEAENFLADYLDGSIDVLSKQHLEEHLGSCSACGETLDEMRFALAACRQAPECAPTPWLIPRIMQRTVGAREAGWARWTRWWRAWWRPAFFGSQTVYGISMAVFSLSFILFASNVNLRGLNVREMNPMNWVRRADSRGHLLVARAEMLYYNFGFANKIQSFLEEFVQPENSPAISRKSPGTGQTRLVLPPRAQSAIYLLPKYRLAALLLTSLPRPFWAWGACFPATCQCSSRVASGRDWIAQRRWAL